MKHFATTYQTRSSETAYYLMSKPDSNDPQAEDKAGLHQSLYPGQRISRNKQKQAETPVAPACQKLLLTSQKPWY